MQTYNNLKRALSCTAIAILITACGGSSSPKKVTMIEQSPVVTVDYQNMIDEMVSERIPGIILLVESPDKRFLGSAGVENTTSQNPMQIYHTMPTASAGKPMIALLAAMLADDNLLNLDDTIDTYLTDDIINQIPNSAEMTLRQLLNHTSGIYNYTDNDSGDANDFNDFLIAEPDKLKTDTDFLALALNQPAYFKPGDGFKYSNTGYSLAGLILDQVLGMHHSIALRERILVPLGMNATYYRGIEKTQGDFISGYYSFNNSDEIYDTKPYLENVGRASAPLISSVEDMAHFLKSIVTNTSFINTNISDDIFGDKSLIQVNANNSYGLGIIVESIGKNTAYQHSGLNYGYHTQNIYIKEKDLSITAFINCSTAPFCENAGDSLIEKVKAYEL